MQELTCWNCGKPVEVPVPVGRGEECPHCDADLRVCRQCGFYDTGYAKDCREPNADEVGDKDRRNTCDYFRPASPRAQAPGSGEADAARARLDALFGGGGDQPKSGGSLADEIRHRQKESGSDADAARAKLDKLFGGKE
jgi:hypothetical protein